MDETQRCLAWGVYTSAALYEAGVFAAGLVTQNPFAWKLAIATAGIAYVSYANPAQDCDGYPQFYCRCRRWHRAHTLRGMT